MVSRVSDVGGRLIVLERRLIVVLMNSVMVVRFVMIWKNGRIR